MGGLERVAYGSIEDVLAEIHPPTKELGRYRRKELKVALEQLERHDSICITGKHFVGKSFFTVHKLVPALKKRGEKVAVFDPFLLYRPGSCPEDVFENESLAAWVPGIRNQLRLSPEHERVTVTQGEVAGNPVYQEFLDYYFSPLKDATVVIIDEAGAFTTITSFKRDARDRTASFLRMLEGKKVVFVNQKGSDTLGFLDYLREIAEEEGIALDLPSPEDRKRVIGLS